MTEAEEAFLLCLSLEQQERVQVLLGERDLAVYALQAERTLFAEDPPVEETATPLGLARELHLMRCEGWDFKWEGNA